MASILQMVQLAAADALLPRNLTERVPEQSVMSSPASVSGFDAAGDENLLPVYHFNARAVAALAGRNSHVLDLGSGTGQFLAYLSRHRPDLTITGLELSDRMVEVGQERLKRLGVDRRVSLLRGDMRDLSRHLSKAVDLVSSVFALHHLETRRDLTACLGEVSKLQATGASLWLFDHVRPRRDQTARRFPDVFTPDADLAFRHDSSNSLKASWSYDELSSALRASGLTKINSAVARFLPFYQIHWIAGLRQRKKADWVESNDLSPQAEALARRFEGLFPFPGLT